MKVFSSVTGKKISYIFDALNERNYTFTEIPETISYLYTNFIYCLPLKTQEELIHLMHELKRTFSMKTITNRCS